MHVVQLPLDPNRLWLKTIQNCFGVGMFVCVLLLVRPILQRMFKDFLVKRAAVAAAKAHVQVQQQQHLQQQQVAFAAAIGTNFGKSARQSFCTVN